MPSPSQAYRSSSAQFNSCCWIASTGERLETTNNGKPNNCSYDTLKCSLQPQFSVRADRNCAHVFRLYDIPRPGEPASHRQRFLLADTWNSLRAWACLPKLAHGAARPCDGCD